jgi:tRNA pseudouridine55 synthase
MAFGGSPDGLLLLDKPAGITSTRALATAKRALHADKAGHTGTLDPFATGLLPLAFGEATKFSRFLIDAVKEYDADLRLGAVSESGDTETPARHVSDVIPEAGRIDAVVRGFVGEQWQMPPMHSAIHVGGRRLYEYAREGREVAREPRRVEILALEHLALEGDLLRLRVRCSKGTYVRTLAADIGTALGCGAYLSALRRTAVGDLRLADAVALETLVALPPATGREYLRPAEQLVASLPREHVDSEAARRFSHGQELAASRGGSSGPVAVFAEGGSFLGVAERNDGRITPLRLLADRPKSPDFP